MSQILSRKSLLTPREAAEVLGIKENTLAAWRSNKRYPLPYVKCGRYVKYKEADVQTFIEQRRVSCEELA